MKGGIPAVFPCVKRFQAVDFRGKGGTVSDFQALQFPMGKSVMYDVMRAAGQRAAPQIVTGGAVGCAQSHLTIWNSFADGSMGSPGEWLLVFEPDAVAQAGLADALQQLTAHPVPANPLPAILKLGWIFVPGTEGPTTHPGLRSVQGPSWGAQAYLVRRSSASALVIAVTPVEAHIDIQFSRLAAVGLAPPVVRTADNLIPQNISHGLSSTITKEHPIAALLPESTTTSNFLIVFPWVVAFGAIIALTVVGVLLGKRSKCK